MVVRGLRTLLFVVLFSSACLSGEIHTQYLFRNYRVILNTTVGVAISSDRGRTFDVRTPGNSGLLGVPAGVVASGQTIIAMFNSDILVSNDGGASFVDHPNGTVGITGGPYDDSNKPGVVTPTGKFILSTDTGILSTTDNGANYIFDGTIPVATVAFAISGSNLYIGSTGNGLYISTDDGTTFPSNKTIVDGLPDNNIWALSTSGSYVYAGTSFGLGVSNNFGASFVTKTIANGLASNTIYKVESAGPYVWASSTVGLSVSSDNGNTFTIKTTADGLPSNTIYDVAYAPGDRTLWVVTDMGVAVSRDYGSTFSFVDYSSYFPNTTVFTVQIY